MWNSPTSSWEFAITQGEQDRQHIGVVPVPAHTSYHSRQDQNTKIKRSDKESGYFTTAELRETEIKLN